MRAPLRVLLALLALTASATWGPRAATAEVAQSFLLITVDTLRADALGFAGNPIVSTPVLNRLAVGGIVFPFAHAHNVVTLPSHTNILTGLYPWQHGVRDNSGFRLPATVPTLATRLADAGFETAAFVGAFPLDSRFGLDRGFGVYDDDYPTGSHPEEFAFAERRGDEVVSRALVWWRQHAGERRFLWIHLFDPHAPYAPPPPFAERFAATPYLGEVAAVDSFLEPLLIPLLVDEQPDTLVVFTADHGEALGEHGELTHGLFAYESTLRIPLVVWGPGIEPDVDRREARHIDILPTALAALGVDLPPGPASSPLPGRSLLLEPLDEASTTYFEALSTTLNRGWAPLRGIVRDRRKFIELPIAEVYDLAADPREKENLFGADSSVDGNLGRWLPAESVWPPPRGEVSSEERELLASLGYIGGTAPASRVFTVDDDPKNLIGLDREIHRTIDLYTGGRAAAAAELALELVRDRPSMPLGYSLAAQALLEAGRTEKALAVMEAAREQGLASDSLLRQLGLTLAESGRHREAIEVLEPLAAGDDTISLNALGLALSEAGRQPEARTVLADSLAADSDNPEAHQTMALVELRSGHWNVARDEARRALALNEELPLAWNNLGVALFYLHQASAALDAWERSIELDAKQYDTLYNLGVKGSEAGRVDRARWALEQFIATAPAERYAADIRQARLLLGQLGAAD